MRRALRLSALRILLLAGAALPASTQLSCAASSKALASPPRRLTVTMQGAEEIRLVAPDGKRVAVRGDSVLINQIPTAEVAFQSVDDVESDEPDFPPHVIVEVRGPGSGQWRIEADGQSAESVSLSIEGAAQSGKMCYAREVGTFDGQHRSIFWKLTLARLADSCTVSLARAQR